MLVGGWCVFQYCKCRLSGAMHPIRIERFGRPVLGGWGGSIFNLFVNVVSVNVNVACLGRTSYDGSSILVVLYWG